MKNQLPRKKQTYEGILAEVFSANVEYLARQLRNKLGKDISSAEFERHIKQIHNILAKANKEVETIATNLSITTKPIIVEESDNARKNTRS